MNPKEFVRSVKRVVLDVAVEGTLNVMRQPPGKRPPPELVKASEWFNRLSREDEKFLRYIIEMAARQTLFGLLAVFDGARQIEESDSKGRFDLRFVKGEEECLLNPPDGLPLHELINEEVTGS